MSNKPKEVRRRVTSGRSKKGKPQTAENPYKPAGRISPPEAEKKQQRLNELKESSNPLSKNNSLKKLEELLEESINATANNQNFNAGEQDEFEGMMDTEENAVIDGVSIERKIRSTSISNINKSTALCVRIYVLKSLAGEC